MAVTSVARGLSGSTPRRRRGGQDKLIKWTPYAATTLIEHVRVDHRRADVSVPKQFLNRPNVVTGLAQMRGKRVAE